MSKVSEEVRNPDNHPMLEDERNALADYIDVLESQVVEVHPHWQRIKEAETRFFNTLSSFLSIRWK